MSQVTKSHEKVHVFVKFPDKKKRKSFLKIKQVRASDKNSVPLRSQEDLTQNEWPLAEMPGTNSFSFFSSFLSFLLSVFICSGLRRQISWVLGLYYVLLTPVLAGSEGLKWVGPMFCDFCLVGLAAAARGSGLMHLLGKQIDSCSSPCLGARDFETQHEWHALQKAGGLSGVAWVFHGGGLLISPEKQGSEFPGKSVLQAGVHMRVEMYIEQVRK